MGKTSDDKLKEKLEILSGECRTLHPAAAAMVNGRKVCVMVRWTVEQEVHMSVSKYFKK